MKVLDLLFSQITETIETVGIILHISIGTIFFIALILTILERKVGGLENRTNKFFNFIFYLFDFLVVIVWWLFMGRGKKISERKERTNKFIHYIGEMCVFPCVGLYLIFIVSIVFGATVMIGVFIVILTTAIWPYWWSLSYLLPVLGLISCSGSFFFLMLSQYCFIKVKGPYAYTS